MFVMYILTLYFIPLVHSGVANQGHCPSGFSSGQQFISLRHGLVCSSCSCWDTPSIPKDMQPNEEFFSLLRRVATISWVYQGHGSSE